MSRTVTLAGIVYGCESLADCTWHELQRGLDPENTRLSQDLDIHPSACVHFVRNKSGLLAMLVMDTQRRACDIVFCGTADVRDIVMNMRVWKTVLPLTQHYGDAYVHSGFLRQLTADGAMDRIVELLNDATAQDWRFTVCGHSLGGALALLCAVLLTSRLYTVRKLEVVTYGAPRVGNVEFALLLDSLHIQCTQIMHRQDPVPHVPKYGYAHAGNLVWLPQAQPVPPPEDMHYSTIFTKTVSLSAAFHSIGNYRSEMSAAVSKL